MVHDWRMNHIKSIVLIVICHLLGDYWLQNNFIASTKGKNWYHLFVHCMLYSVPFLIVFGWSWQLVFITILHFPIDALKARYNKITYLQDQILHYILATSYLI